MLRIWSQIINDYIETIKDDKQKARLKELLVKTYKDANGKTHYINTMTLTM